MTSLDTRVGRLRELRFFALHVLGIVIASAFAVAAGQLAARYGSSWVQEFTAATLFGGMALSAQLAKGRVREQPVYTLVLVLSGIAFGVIGALLLR